MKFFPSVAEQFRAGAFLVRAMRDSTYYRNEARRCRQLARIAKTIDAARRWTEIADDYDQLAISLERSGRPIVQRVPMQQQPAQHQQAEIK